jgi:hypothetical protein
VVHVILPPLLEYVPAAQYVHAPAMDWPDRELFVPGGHGTTWPAMQYAPGGHAPAQAASPGGVYLPSSHADAMHCTMLELAAGEKGVAGGHARHALARLAPVSGRYVLNGHGMHDAGKLVLPS